MVEPCHFVPQWWSLAILPSSVDKDNCDRHHVLHPFANTTASALARSTFNLEDGHD
jgi:hypothetical protein